MLKSTGTGTLPAESDRHRAKTAQSTASTPRLSAGQQVRGLLGKVGAIRAKGVAAGRPPGTLRPADRLNIDDDVGDRPVPWSRTSSLVLQDFTGRDNVTAKLTSPAGRITGSSSHSGRTGVRRKAFVVGIP